MNRNIAPIRPIYRLLTSACSITLTVVTGEITVRARIRQRTRHDEPVSTDERWDEATASSYEDAQAVIQARVADDELVLAWYVER